VSKALTPSNIGAGGTLGALQTGTGSALMGGSSNADTPGSPILAGGEIGTATLAFNDNLTAAEILALMSYKAPTTVFGGVPVGAVSAWLRFANGTSDANGFSSVPDVLNSNPAVQPVNSAKPARVLSANGLPMADFDGTTDFWTWPLIAANNSTTAIGFMFWIVPDDVSGDERLITIWLGVGASTHKCIFEKTGAALRVFVRNGAANPEALTGNVLSPGVPVCVGWEFNGAGATDAAKLVITVNGVAVASTNGALPATMNAPTGDINIGTYASAVLPFAGLLGPNILCFGSAMAGVTSGLLTPAARLAIANFERPT